MILEGEATPAQIGAFMIAHRIKRPTGEELAGLLDAYADLGPWLKPIAAPHPAVVFGVPYDGRSRTAPITPLTALILAAADCPVVMHGGDRMPTKYGMPLIEVWQLLGVDWTHLTLDQLQQVFAQTFLGLIYSPLHFPLAAGLVPYRDQIGKRPPFATLELMWCPYEGEAILVSGYVHPPTEQMMQDALTRYGTSHFITVKGLEGSCDLPRDRTCIIGITQTQPKESFERLLLHPRDYGFAGKEVALVPTTDLTNEMQAVLSGQTSDLGRSVIWNAGFYLWQLGVCTDLEAGFSQAESILQNGQAIQKLTELREAIAQSTKAGGLAEKTDMTLKPLSNSLCGNT
jgi:anthranilate phosphoribosyltransferase